MCLAAAVQVHTRVCSLRALTMSSAAPVCCRESLNTCVRERTDAFEVTSEVMLSLSRLHTSDNESSGVRTV